jgi:hypothetical protein
MGAVSDNQEACPLRADPGGDLRCAMQEQVDHARIITDRFAVFDDLS